jgi:hypothetical protein
MPCVSALGENWLSVRGIYVSFKRLFAVVLAPVRKY